MICSKSLQEVDDLFREVGNALDRNATCAEFGVRRERVAEQSRTRLRLHATGGLEARAVERCTAQQQRGLLAVRQQPGCRIDGIRADRCRQHVRQLLLGALGFVPGGVGRENQR